MVNYHYRDRLFRALFGREEYKENLLSLYNALNHTNYTNTDDMEIYTIDDVIYMSMKNDVSCLIDYQLSMFEHQTTWNPNMPLRGFLYFGRQYSKFIEMTKLNVYSTKQLTIPTPQYYVLYNGNADIPERTVLKLSDSFKHPVEADTFQWTSIVLNINSGKNRALMDNCRILWGYTYLCKSSAVRPWLSRACTNETMAIARINRYEYVGR